MGYGADIAQIIKKMIAPVLSRFGIIKGKNSFFFVKFVIHINNFPFG